MGFLSWHTDNKAVEMKLTDQSRQMHTDKVYKKVITEKLGPFRGQNNSFLCFRCVV